MTNNEPLSEAETWPTPPPGSEHPEIHQAVAHKAKNINSAERLGRIIRSLGVFIVVMLIALSTVSLVYVVQTSQQIADCTTPTGKCAQRGQEATRVAVKQIIDGVDQLSKARQATASTSLQNQAQIIAALRVICAQQHIDCPSLNTP